MRIRDEERRLARRRDLPDGAPGTRDDEVGRGECRPELLRVGKEAIVRSARARIEVRKVAFAREMEHGRPLLGERFERGLVQVP